MGNAGGADERLVGGIEEDERLVRVRPVHPCLELLLCGGGAGGVVRVAEIDHVHRLGKVGGRGNEPVGGGAGEVDEPGIASVRRGAGAAGHHVGVDIDGIDGVGDGDLHVGAEQLLYVAAVALRAVGDEHLVGGNVDAAVLEVVLCDGFAQEGVALLRTVAAERLAGGLVVDGPVEGGDDGRGERLGDVADAEADDLRAGVGVLVGLDAVGDLGEKV